MSGKIEINNKTKRNVSTTRVNSIINRFIRQYRAGNKSLSVAFVGDKTIRKLNYEYLGKDRVTDVLAFPGEDDFFGEIIINLAQIKRQAGQYENSEAEELIFVLVHGLFHLLGYRDDTAKKKEEMDRLTKDFISQARS